MSTHSPPHSSLVARAAAWLAAVALLVGAASIPDAQTEAPAAAGIEAGCYFCMDDGLDTNECFTSSGSGWTHCASGHQHCGFGGSPCMSG